MATFNFNYIYTVTSMSGNSGLGIVLLGNRAGLMANRDPGEMPIGCPFFSDFPIFRIYYRIIGISKSIIFFILGFWRPP